MPDRSRLKLAFLVSQASGVLGARRNDEVRVKIPRKDEFSCPSRRGAETGTQDAASGEVKFLASKATAVPADRSRLKLAVWVAPSASRMGDSSIWIGEVSG